MSWPRSLNSGYQAAAHGIASNLRAHRFAGNFGQLGSDEPVSGDVSSGQAGQVTHAVVAVDLAAVGATESANAQTQVQMTMVLNLEAATQQAPVDLTACASARR